MISFEHYLSRGERDKAVRRRLSSFEPSPARSVGFFPVASVRPNRLGERSRFHEWAQGAISSASLTIRLGTLSAERPLSSTFAGQQPAELEPREVCGGCRDVGAFELSGQRLA